jgi:hypothetical protein
MRSPYCRLLPLVFLLAGAGGHAQAETSDSIKVNRAQRPPIEWKADRPGAEYKNYDLSAAQQPTPSGGAGASAPPPQPCGPGGADDCAAQPTPSGGAGASAPPPQPCGPGGADDCAAQQPTPSGGAGASAPPTPCGPGGADDCAAQGVPDLGVKTLPKGNADIFTKPKDPTGGCGAGMHRGGDGQCYPNLQ